VHPSYAVFAAILLLGFLAARFLLAPHERMDLLRIGGAIGAVLIPAALFFVWLLPAAIWATPSFSPAAAERLRLIRRYPHQIQLVGHAYRLFPQAISTHGPVAVAALLALPASIFGIRKRWAAFVLGSALLMLLILLVPEFFRLFTDAVSIPQGRRMVLFLPWAFAFAGGAFVLGRLGPAGVIVGLAAGIALQHAYPGDFTYGARHGGGAAWPVWVAVAGGGAVLIAGTFIRRWRPSLENDRRWMAWVALAFIAPVAWSARGQLHQSRYPSLPVPGLINAVRGHVRAGDVVFANVRLSYTIVAYAPVYVAAVPRGHAWDRPDKRIRDVNRFFAPDTSDAERLRILRKYRANWLVLDPRDGWLDATALFGSPVYQDPGHALYGLGELQELP
jgi:hypothetical protein